MAPLQEHVTGQASRPAGLSSLVSQVCLALPRLFVKVCDGDRADDITNLTEVNGQLMEQMASLNKQLELAQADAQQAFEAASAQRSQQAHMHSETSQALIEQVAYLNKQLEQAQFDLQRAQYELSAQQAQQAAESSRDIANLAEVNQQLRDQITDLNRQLVEALASVKEAQDAAAAQHAQQAADGASEVTNLTEENRQLRGQLSDLHSQLEQAQSEAQHAQHRASAQHAQQVSDLSQQLQQAQHELQLAPKLHSAQQPLLNTEDGKADGVDDKADKINGSQLSEHTCTLTKQLEQTQAELTHVQDHSAAQHAQQAADSTGDITDLTQANSQLLAQVAECKAQVVQAQREAQSATGQLQHMRDLVKAQHAKREEHAASLQAESDSLQQECKAKDLKVRPKPQRSLCCKPKCTCNPSVNTPASCPHTRLHHCLVLHLCKVYNVPGMNMALAM